MKSYFLFYTDDMGTADDVAGELDRMPTVENWRYDIPNIMYLVSESSAKELSDALKNSVGDNKGHYAFIECTDNADGLLYSDSWNFLDSPQKLK